MDPSTVQTTSTIDDTIKAAEENRWLQLFSILVHDLESPLASMKYVLQLLDENRLDTSLSLHRQLISSSKVAVERAESIVYDILAVAKSGNIGLPVNMNELNPEPLLQEAIVLAKGTAQPRDVELFYEPPESPLIVKADSNLLRRVLDNLIYNGIRHTPSGGNIKVYTSIDPELLNIHIKDSGSGLQGVNPELLFEKFGQAQLRADGKHRGVGLGLYFCRLATNGMGGAISADDHPDGGAVFTIGLSLVKG